MMTDWLRRHHPFTGLFSSWGAPKPALVPTWPIAVQSPPDTWQVPDLATLIPEDTCGQQIPGAAFQLPGAPPAKRQRLNHQTRPRFSLDLDSTPLRRASLPAAFTRKIRPSKLSFTSPLASSTTRCKDSTLTWQNNTGFCASPLTLASPLTVDMSPLKVNPTALETSPESVNGSPLDVAFRLSSPIVVQYVHSPTNGALPQHDGASPPPQTQPNVSVYHTPTNVDISDTQTHHHITPTKCNQSSQKLNSSFHRDLTPTRGKCLSPLSMQDDFRRKRRCLSPLRDHPEPSFSCDLMQTSGQSLSFFTPEEKQSQSTTFNPFDHDQTPSKGLSPFTLEEDFISGELFCFDTPTRDASFSSEDDNDIINLDSSFSVHETTFCEPISERRPVIQDTCAFKPSLPKPTFTFTSPCDALIHDAEPVLTTHNHISPSRSLKPFRDCHLPRVEASSTIFRRSPFTDRRHTLAASASHCRSPAASSVQHSPALNSIWEEEDDEDRNQRGGSVVDAGNPECTHLVVDEQNVKNVKLETHPRLHVIKQEWFWASIQMDACADEAMYTYTLPNGTPASVGGGKSTPHTLSAGSKSRKRKRLRENLAQLAHEGEVAGAGTADTPLYKRRSSSNQAGAAEITHMSISSMSFLDDTKSPNISDTLTDPFRGKSPSTPTLARGDKEPVRLTARQQAVMEFFQTEKNYVGILHTIIKTFKEEIERPDQPGGPLLDPTDVKMIFGKIPPLFDVHMRIRDELGEVVADWADDQYCIGSIILKHADALQKSYPPFVNFFEQTKQVLEKCDREKPRFHAFLKVCQSKPECGRQTLRELLIRPVQRLPSVMLLLRLLNKRTDTAHPDHGQLDAAITALEEVMTHINEDKRKTEGHQVMFDIINDIENCPPNLLSSHRRFISKLDVVELTSELPAKAGDRHTLFVFSDSVEMCKRRVKVLSSKSPGGVSATKTPQKAYKHLDVIQLSCIKRVLDIVETPECHNVFALVTKKLSEAEKLYAFVIEDGGDKAAMLETLSRAICHVTCRTDFATLQATVDAQTLNLDTSELWGAAAGGGGPGTLGASNKTLSKAATRFGKRVSRAFSFNKTPRKLKRAMSSMTQMMSPFNRRESGVFSANTPRGNMAAMRLASVNDLTDDTTYSETMYSDLVDSVSLGARTPAMSRRTLAELDEMSICSNFSQLSEASTCLPPMTTAGAAVNRRETLARETTPPIGPAAGAGSSGQQQKRAPTPSTPKAATFGFRTGSKLL